MQVFSLILVVFLAGRCSGDAVAYVSGPWKLTIINNDGGFAQETRQRIIDTFFQNYPQIQPRFNGGARQDVQLTIDPGYNGVAYAGKLNAERRKIKKRSFCVLQLVVPLSSVLNG